MNIECDQTKVALIGSFVNFGLTVGALIFSIITKYLSYRQLIIWFVWCYVLFLFLTTVIDSFETSFLACTYTGSTGGYDTPAISHGCERRKPWQEISRAVNILLVLDCFVFFVLVYVTVWQI